MEGKNKILRKTSVSYFAGHSKEKITKKTDKPSVLCVNNVYHNILYGPSIIFRR